MKVQDLINELKKHNPNEEIYLANDSEGNSIKTISDIAHLEDGEFVEVNKGDDGAQEIAGKHYKWTPTQVLLVLYPTDTIVNNN